VAGRDEQNRFWRAIATGLSSEDAALEAGVSQPVGTRLFRKAGGMPPVMFRSPAKPLSGRYLSLGEREEIALLTVQGHSMQEIGRRLRRAASTISRELRRNAATRSGGLEYRGTTAPSGMRIDPPVGPNRPSLRSTQPCALMWRRDLPASS
jgi:Helix-turn-helix domain